IASKRYHCYKHPVAGASLEEHLLASLGVDGAERIVGAAESDELGIVRPAAAVDGVEGDGDRHLESAFLDVPYLHFAKSARIAAGNCEPFAIGREGKRLDAFGDADETRDQAAAVGLVHENFVI